MSKDALAKVVQRAISDGAFRRQLSKDPTAALRGFELSSAEAAAIRSGDAGRLSALGVDLRMSKAFTLAAGDTVSNTVSSDLGASNTGVLTSADGTTGSGALTSGDGAGGTGALIGSDSATSNAAFTGGGGAMGSAALVSGDTSDTDPMIASGNDVGREGAVIGDAPAHAFGDETGDEYLPSFNTLTPGDEAAQNVVVSDDGASGASTPGEAGGGPEIQP